MKLWEVAVVALGAAIVFTPLCMRAARILHVVDNPGPLKPQSTPVPYLGGIAVLLALLVSTSNHLALIGPLALATLIGVADDVADLPPVVRLLGQAVVGLTIAAVVTTRLPGVVAVVAAMGVAIVLMNGVNLVDGLDALAATVVGSSAAGFAVLRGGSSRELGVALVCASAGFLVFNRPPARVYLGDGGSYLLGAALAELLMLSWTPGSRSATGVAALLLVAVPAAELGVTVLRRFRAGSNLVSGDRGHSYDRMVAGGAPVPLVVFVFFAVQVFLVGLAAAVRASRSLAVAVAMVVVVSAALMATAVRSGLLVPEGRTGR